MAVPSDDITRLLPRHTGALLALIRGERPRVHVLTNFVAMNVSANVMLAVGAIPSMTFRADAMADFVAGSAALVVNLGQLEPEREAAIKRATPLARELQRPWVLDPVKVERSGFRHDLAIGLLRMQPAAVRANVTEIAALADGEPGESATQSLALATGAVVAATGEIDLVTDGRRSVRIANGSPLMDRVTAMGCASTALLGCFLAVEPDPFIATAAALLAFGVAGEVAAGRCGGPGTFEPQLLDALFTLDGPTLAREARFV